MIVAGTQTGPASHRRVGPVSCMQFGEGPDFRGDQRGGGCRNSRNVDSSQTKHFLLCRGRAKH